MSWREALRARAAVAMARPLEPRPRELRAAVLVPILDSAPGLELLLLRRPATLTHHGGQYAFPGGKIEPGDAGAVAAALREAREEVGLAEERVEVLAPLSDLRTPTGYLITPILAVADRGSELRPSPDEVDLLIRVPVAFLLERGAFRRVRREARGLVVLGDALAWKGHVVWGATARILLALRGLLRGIDGPWSTPDR